MWIKLYIHMDEQFYDAINRGWMFKFWLRRFSFLTDPTNSKTPAGYTLLTSESSLLASIIYISAKGLTSN